MPNAHLAAIGGLLFGLLMLISVPAQAFETYTLRGLTADDKLIIRAEPHEGGKPADWQPLGSIPADVTHILGTGRSKRIGGQRWREIVFDGVTGWVNARFLAPGEPADLQNETFRCAGTEPFWGVRLGPKSSEFSNPETTTKLITERVQPAQARRFPLLYRLRDPKGLSVRATVTHQTCSDGMSDYDYAFQVLLSDDAHLYEGCCVLQR